MAAPTEQKLPTDPKYDHYDFPTIAAEPQDGHPGHTTPEQDAKVHQLRTMLEQQGFTERLDTLTLLRFLRARKFDVELAKAMYVVFSFPERGGPVGNQGKSPCWMTNGARGVARGRSRSGREALSRPSHLVPLRINDFLHPASSEANPSGASR